MLQILSRTLSTSHRIFRGTCTYLYAKAKQLYAVLTLTIFKRSALYWTLYWFKIFKDLNVSPRISRDFFNPTILYQNWAKYRTKINFYMILRSQIREIIKQPCSSLHIWSNAHLYYTPTVLFDYSSWLAYKLEILVFIIFTRLSDSLLSIKLTRPAL